MITENRGSCTVKEKTHKKGNQMDVSHTQEGIGHQPAGQVEGKPRQWRNHGREKIISSSLSPETRAERCANHGMGNFVGTVSGRGGHSICRRPPRSIDMQTRNEDLVVADKVRSTRHGRHLGTATGKAKLRGRTHDDRWDRSMQDIQTVHGSGGVPKTKDGTGMSRGLGRCLWGGAHTM
jgi:hypothetical protein